MKTTSYLARGLCLALGLACVLGCGTRGNSGGDRSTMKQVNIEWRHVAILLSGAAAAAAARSSRGH